MNLNSDGWKQKVSLILENAGEWIVHHKAISVPTAVILLVALLAGASFLNKEKAADDETAESASVPEVQLEENAVAAVNELMNSYYTALADGNIEKLESLTNYISDPDKLKIQKKSSYIEQYNNIICYTKAGMVEDSYLVYVYQEVKLYDYDTPVPSLNTFVVYKNSEGSYYIYEGDLDDNTLAYFDSLSAQDDVTNLCNSVQAKYNEAVAKDEGLSDFMDGFKDLIRDEVAMELAAITQEETEAESGNAESEGEAEPAAEEQPQEEAPQQMTAQVTEVETIDTVNVRSSDSETADKVGRAEKGVRLPLVEKRENGWSKVEFEGKEAFIKSEFLADVVNTSGDSEQQASAGTSENTESDSGSGSSGSLVGQNGKVTAKTTVNVRASANENGERLGVIYAGEQLELVMQQADGWCKVKYDGQTGFVKTEFVE